MTKQAIRARRVARGTLLAAIVAAGLAVVPSAIESSTHDGLQASVVASNPGPLHVCASPCGGADTTWHVVYVSNKNELGDVFGHAQNRTTLPNAFVVSSVEQTIFVDGQLYTDYTFTPPPDVNFPSSYSGHWPSTVTCPPGGPPCNVVISPAVIPGEQAAVVYVGWAHGAGEPNGKYLFQFTVHGTLNGTPVDITATSKPIFMTD